MNKSLPIITSADIKGKTVLARVDFNVTVNEQNVIVDRTKILENIPTINYLINGGAKKIVLFSHRSILKKNGAKEKTSFEPLIKELENTLKHRIHLVDPRDVDAAEATIKKSNNNELILFDNTRLHPSEETCDTRYGKRLSSLGDLFVYEAFASYRPETTTVVLPRFLPTYIGFTMQQEISVLSSIFKKPKRPLICIVGGAKTEVKVGIVRKFLEFADTVILGGAVANTFLHGWGIHLGSSLVDMEMVSVARELLWLALHSRVALELPHDFTVGRIGSKNHIRSVLHTEITPEYAAFDIGPSTRKRYAEIIKTAGTVVWNGPMGKLEDEEFRFGTKAVLDAMIESKAKKIIGGGDTITALSRQERTKIDHISTGGGAMLVFLESGTTAPIEAIQKYTSKQQK